MFLNTLTEQNKPLAEYALYAHQKGLLYPDTYLLDLDTMQENAHKLCRTGKENGVNLYFMLKQVGRIPAIGKAMQDIGFAGAVCVDFREALHLVQNGVHLGNVGHLVQTPRAALEEVLNAQPDIVTVYSMEKAAEISELCRSLGRRQNIMLRVIDTGDLLYPGQVGGFYLESLGQTAAALQKLEGVSVAGVCSFPCLMFDETLQTFITTQNLRTVQKAAETLRAMGLENLQVNLPSASCCASIPLIRQNGGTHAEPGHALTGTTPYHALPGSGPERTAMLYLSEISHTLGGVSYCYGGGYYRRGHLQNALIGTGLEQANIAQVHPLSPENIDYHLELAGRWPVSAPVIMCFRTQIFVTRSEVAVIRGLAKGAPTIAGIYSAQGHLLRGGR